MGAKSTILIRRTNAIKLLLSKLVPDYESLISNPDIDTAIENALEEMSDKGMLNGFCLNNFLIVPDDYEPKNEWETVY